MRFFDEVSSRGTYGMTWRAVATLKEQDENTNRTSSLASQMNVPRAKRRSKSNPPSNITHITESVGMAALPDKAIKRPAKER